MRMGMNPFSSASVITTTGIMLFWSIPTTFTFILTTGLTPGSAVYGYSSIGATRLLPEPQPIGEPAAAPLQLTRLPVRRRPAHEASIERVRPIGTRPPFWMKLATAEPRMIWQFDDLDETPVRREARQAE